MTAELRPTASPLPGDLYLDPAVPEGEQLSLTRNGWAVRATHVWTGSGWTRLVPGVVRDVPAHPEVTLPCAPAPRPAVEPAPAAPATPLAPAAGIERYRRRRVARESVAELVRERTAAGAAEHTAR